MHNKQSNALKFHKKPSISFAQHCAIAQIYFCYFFISKKYKKKINRNFDKVGKNFQNIYFYLSFLALFFGMFKCRIPSTDLYLIEYFVKNLPILKNSEISRSWKTFYLTAQTRVGENVRENFLSFKKIKVSTRDISLILTKFWINKKNQNYVVLLPLKIKNQPIIYSHYFKQPSFYIFLRKSFSTKLDLIPTKMENQFFQSADQLIKYKLFIQPPKTTLVLKKQDIKKIKSRGSINLKANKQFFFTKDFKFLIKIQQFYYRKKFWINRKKEIPVSKELYSFSDKNELKILIDKFYRELFYQKDYDPKDCAKYALNTYRPARALKRLAKQSTYPVVIKAFKPFHLSTMAPSFQYKGLSGYIRPDSQTLIKDFGNNAFYSSLNEPFSIKVKLPSNYKYFFNKFFLETSKKHTILSFYKLKKSYKNIFIDPDFKKIIINYLSQKTDFNTNYKKRFTAYNTTDQKQSHFLLYLMQNFTSSNFYRNLFPISTQFYDIREPIHDFSWLIITQVGFGIMGFRLFQYLYIEYGKEIVLSIISLIKFMGIIEDEEWLKEELEIAESKDFRSVRKVNKSFKQTAGISSLIIALSEILWYLRTKKLILSKIISAPNKDIKSSLYLKPILMIGPPGTGKTLLVQALAGETRVPVLIQSGAVLKNFKQRGRGARSIQNLFRRARKIAPCLVFIDEVDSIGVRRQNLSLNPTGEHDAIETINDLESKTLSFDDLVNFKPKTNIKVLDDEDDDERNLNFDQALQFGETLTDVSQKNLVRIKVLQENQVEEHLRTEQLSILTQLLIELDGLTPINDIVVFGATNRIHVIDPALLRPGRFYKILKLTLPNEDKRIEVLKLYTRNIGIQKSMPWRYLSQRMDGLSAADIAAIVNVSTLITLCQNWKGTHTVKTLEEGLDRITSYSFIKSSYRYKKKFFSILRSLRGRFFNNNLFLKNYKTSLELSINKLNLSDNRENKQFLRFKEFYGLAYYQSGKSVAHRILPKHPLNVYFSFQERTKNFRYMAMNGLILNIIERVRFKNELEYRLIGLMAGKASEFLAISYQLMYHLKNLSLSKKNFFDMSNIGNQDNQFACLLAFLMVEKWFLYAERICTQSYHPVLDKSNIHEFEQDEIKLFQAIIEEAEAKLDFENRLKIKTQKWSYRSWWQKQIVDEESFFDKSAMDWYRIYLPEPEESEQNIEWLPPDEVFNAAQVDIFANSIFWSKFLKITYDHIYHALILNCFNFAFSLLSNNMELLDYLADFSLRHEKVRNYQIKKITRNFFSEELRESKTTLIRDTNVFIKPTIIVHKNWGKTSRRQVTRTININDLKKIHISPPKISNLINEEQSKNYVEKFKSSKFLFGID